MLEAHAGSTTSRGTPSEARRILERYFAGEVGALDGIEVDAQGTPFQKRVWAALREIPVGETRSYADVARAIGAPAAVRAVATANARNPVAIIVPCHRVIGSDGQLRGYGGGLPRKAWLLEHERRGQPLAKQLDLASLRSRGASLSA